MVASRPRKSDITREKILDTALALFRDKGFQRTTMREIATEAGVATGASYYYFRSKEELVMAFYLRTSDDAREGFSAILERYDDLSTRIEEMVRLKLAQFAEHRALMAALLKAGIDPRDDLSPFSAATKDVREESIDWFRRAIDGSTVRVPEDLEPHLPRLLWLYQMAIVYYWIVDESPDQEKTHRLLDATLDLILSLLKASSLPLMSPLRRKIISVLSVFE